MHYLHIPWTTGALPIFMVYERTYAIRPPFLLQDITVLRCNSHGPGVQPIWSTKVLTWSSISLELISVYSV